MDKYSSTLRDHISAFDRPVDPKEIVQNMMDVIKDERAAEGDQLADFYSQSLEELKHDPDFSKLLREFKEALKGERNIMTIGIFAVCLFSL